jgi:heme exporter protein D
MMPDLGKYAFAVLASYGAGLGLMAGLVLMSLRQGLRARKSLDDIEDR